MLMYQKKFQVVLSTPRAFSGGPVGQIATLQKISKNKNGTKWDFAPFLFFDIFYKVAIWPTGPPENALGVLRTTWKFFWHISMFQDLKIS